MKKASKTSKQKSLYTFVWNDYQPHSTIEGNIIPLERFRSIIWNQINNIIQVSRDNMIYCYHSNKDLKDDREKGRHFFKKDYLKRYFREVDKNYNIQWKIFKTLDTTNLKDYSNKELLILYKRSIFHWGKMISYFRSTQEHGIYYLVKELKKVFIDKEATILMTSTELDLANKEVIDWQKVAGKPYSEKILLKHAKKYPWVVMSHFSFDDVIETLTQRYHFDKKHPQRYDFVDGKKNIRKKQELLLKNFKDKTELVKLLQKLALYRMKVKSCWGGLDFYRIKLINEIARRSEESVADISRYYLIKDIENLLNGKPLSLIEKQNRKKCFVGLWKNGKVTYLSGEKAEEVAREELKELYIVKKVSEVKGMVANSGRVRGIARILPTNDIEKTRELRENFQKGQILFTGMTQPNIMDIASRAGAIVTDEGGMLSHAAVISREFKIPCIVGTHFGTQIFKDGDLVEVDADRGTVRILK